MGWQYANRWQFGWQAGKRAGKGGKWEVAGRASRAGRAGKDFGHAAGVIMQRRRGISKGGVAWLQVVHVRGLADRVTKCASSVLAKGGS